MVHQWVCHRVRHHRPFPERGPSPPRLPLGSQLLLKRLILADAHASALSVGGFGALGSQGPGVTRRRRQLGRLAGDHRDGLAPRTGHLPPGTVQEAIMLREKRTDLRPGARENVHAWLRPLGTPWAGHGPQVDSELQPAGGLLPRRRQQRYRLMRRLMRRADHSLPADFAIPIDGKGLLEAVEGFGAAFAAVAPGCILDRDAPVRRDRRREPSPARSTPRGLARGPACESA